MATPKVRLPFDDSQCLTQGFGERPEVYRARFGLPGHNGIDWGLLVGTPILAVDAGKVIVRHTSATGFGRYIKLQHSWGQTLYAHLDEFQVGVGDVVECGQMVGFSGNSGFSTGPTSSFRECVSIPTARAMAGTATQIRTGSSNGFPRKKML